MKNNIINKEDAYQELMKAAAIEYRPFGGNGDMWDFYTDDLDRYFNLKYSPMKKNDLNTFIKKCFYINNIAVPNDYFDIELNGSQEDEDIYNVLNSYQYKNSKGLEEICKEKPEFTDFWENLFKEMNEYHLNMYGISEEIQNSTKYNIINYIDILPFEKIKEIFKHMVIQDGYAKLYSELDEEFNLNQKVMEKEDGLPF